MKPRLEDVPAGFILPNRRHQRGVAMYTDQTLKLSLRLGAHHLCVHLREHATIYDGWRCERHVSNFGRKAQFALSRGAILCFASRH
jgi:hypothetical protein